MTLRDCGHPGVPSGAIRMENVSFDAFCEQLCAVHSNWELSRPAETAMNARFFNNAVGGVGFTDVALGFSLSGHRTTRQIRRMTDSFYGVILMLAGEHRLRQGDNEVTLGPGDLSVWDASRPAEFSARGPVRQISVLIPRAKLNLYASTIEDVCAQRIDGHSGLGLLLASHLQTLGEVLPSADAATCARAEAATLDLINAAIRPETAGAYKSSIHRTMLHRIQDYMISNLHDPGLSPKSIADAFRISPRYLHKLFEASEHTVSEWLLHRRLLACRASFQDPALNHMTITEIAFSVGFNSAPYFSRVYRQAFGTTPTATRAAQSPEESAPAAGVMRQNTRFIRQGARA